MWKQCPRSFAGNKETIPQFLIKNIFFPTDLASPSFCFRHPVINHPLIGDHGDQAK
ncbi:hypothetical protein AVEN_1644-1, partial [Araneus ventricosus]